MSQIRKLLILCLVLVISACNMVPTKTTIKPSDVQGGGVLIGKIESNGTMPQYADAYIDGTMYKDAVFNGDLALALKPGTYTLEKITFEYRTSNSRHYEGYPINRRFTVAAGRVVNIGHVFAYYKKAMDTQYMLFSINNNDLVHDYLKKVQPDIYPMFKDQKIHLEKGEYISANELSRLRKLIAYSVFYNGGGKQTIVNGKLGTVARIKMGRDNKIADIDIIETGTLYDVKQCSQSEKNYACIITGVNSSKILTGTIGGASRSTDLVIKGDDIKIHLHGSKNIALVDDRLNLYESTDGGKSFSVFSQYARQEPIVYKHWYNLQGSEKGYYLTVFSLDEEKNKIIFKSYTKGATYKDIPLPKGVNLRGLHETRNALVLGAYPGSLSSSDVYYMPEGSEQWIKAEVPTTQCDKIDVLDYKSGKLRMTCGYVEGHKTYYSSNNSGVSWKRN